MFDLNKYVREAGTRLIFEPTEYSVSWTGSVGNAFTLNPVEKNPDFSELKPEEQEEILIRAFANKKSEASIRNAIETIYQAYNKLKNLDGYNKPKWISNKLLDGTIEISLILLKKS